MSFETHSLPNGMGVQIDKDTEAAYKRAGEYMMNSINYEQSKPIVNELSEEDKILMLACESLKGGLSANELTDMELMVLFKRLERRWFDKFGLTIDEIESTEQRIKKLKLMTDTEKEFSELSGKSHKSREENERLKQLKKKLRKEK